MGKLLNEIINQKINTGGRRSQIDVILEKYSGEDHDDLLCALRNKTISPTIIRKVLAKHGHPVTRNAIDRWRSREQI